LPGTRRQGRRMYRSKRGIGAFDRLQGRSSAAEHAERAEVVLIAGTGAVAVNPAPAPGGTADQWQALVWRAVRGAAARPGAHRVRDGVDQVRRASGGGVGFSRCTAWRPAVSGWPSARGGCDWCGLAGASGLWQAGRVGTEGVDGSAVGGVPPPGRAVALTERQTARKPFGELCRLADEPTPAEGDRDEIDMSAVRHGRYTDRLGSSDSATRSIPSLSSRIAFSRLLT
jgi:hypothetical protein